MESLNETEISIKIIKHDKNKCITRRYYDIDRR